LGFSRIVTIFQSNKLENHQWGADHGLGLNDLGVGNIEIIKGPASILYGSGALGGVLLVKDDEPYLYTKDATGSYGFTYNSISGGYRPRFSAGKSNEKGFFIATDIAYENHADYKDGHGRIIGNSRYNSKNFRVHTGYHSETFSNKFSYTFLDQRLGIIDDAEMDDNETLATTRFDRKMQLPFQEVTDHVISYRQNTTHKKWETSLNLSYHINTRKEIEDDFNMVDLGLQQTHLFYNARVSHQTTKMVQNTFGVQGSWINNNNLAAVQEILIPDASIFDVGMYFMTNIDLGDYFLQGGLRYDFRDVKAMASGPLFVDYGFQLPGNPESGELTQSFKGFTGSLGASRKWNKYHTFKANLSTGFRAPDLAELFSNGPHPGTNRFEMGNANFGREQSFQGDLSWIYTGKKLRASVSIFGNIVENYIYFTGTDAQTDDGLEVWEFRQTDAKLYGTEMQLGYHPYKDDRLFFTATANFVRGQDLDNDTNLTFIPADNFMGRVDFKPISGKSLTTFAALRYVDAQNRPGLNEVNTPMYALLSAGVNQEFTFDNKTLALGITGFNLLNRTYFDHMSILRAFEVNHAGRNIMVNVQYRF
jgi:iron complex outermembrane receptor protein